jgi:hypothetical protein
VRGEQICPAEAGSASIVNSPWSDGREPPSRLVNDSCGWSLRVSTSSISGHGSFSTVRPGRQGKESSNIEKPRETIRERNWFRTK